MVSNVAKYMKKTERQLRFARKACFDLYLHLDTTPQRAAELEIRLAEMNFVLQSRTYRK